MPLIHIPPPLLTSAWNSGKKKDWRRRDNESVGGPRVMEGCVRLICMLCLKQDTCAKVVKFHV